MSRRKRLFRRKLLQAKKAQKELKVVVPSRMKRKSLLDLIPEVEKIKL